MPGFERRIAKDWVGLAASGKAIGKNLIKNGIFDPIWSANLHSPLQQHDKS